MTHILTITLRSQKFKQKIGQYISTPGLDPLTKVMGIKQAFGEVLKATTANTEQRVKLERMAGNIDQFSQEVLRINQAIETGQIGPAEGKLAIERAKNVYGLGNIEVPRPFESQRLYEDHLSRQDNIDKLQQAGIIRAAERQKLTQKSRTFLAISLIDNPGAIESIKQNKAFYAMQGVPEAIAVAEQYIKGQKNNNDLLLQIQTTRQKIAELQKNDVRWFIGQASQGRLPSATQILQSLGLGLPTPTDSGGLTPQQAEQAQAAHLAVQNEYVRRLQLLQQQYDQSNSQLQAYGLAGKNKSELRTLAQQYRAEYEENIKMFQSAIDSQTQKLEGTNNPFKRSSTSRSRGTANFATTTYQGRQIKLPLEASGPVTGVYGEDRGTHSHAGLDIAVPVGTKIISPVSGKVIRIEDHGTGYGQMLDVLGDDGKVHRFAHLQRRALYVKVGQQVDAGDYLAKTGNTGTGTGPHLHWEVRDKASVWGFSGTYDPANYSFSNNNVPTPTPKPRTLNTGEWHLQFPRTPGIPQQPVIPANAVPLPGGKYILNDKVHDAQLRGGRLPLPTVPIFKKHSAANPVRGGYASNNINDYKGWNLDANYGYKELAQDAAFRRKLNQTAQKLNIPGQWLSDLIAFESAGTFSASVDNGVGYVGLIQFGSAAASDMGTTQAALSQMSRVQQLDYVYKYLAPFKKDLRKGIEYLIGAVWGGRGLVNELNRRGSQAVVNDPNWNDYAAGGGASFRKYVDRIGEHVGRRYNVAPISRKNRIQARTHTGYHANCRMCAAIRESGSQIIPHEGETA